MNNEFKRMQQLAGIKEITLRPASRTLSDQDINDINLAFNDFGAGHSEQDFTKPVTEYRTALDFGEGRVINGVLTDFEPHDNPDEFPEYQAFLRLLAKPPGYYITHTIFPNSPHPFTCPLKGGGEGEGVDKLHALIGAKETYGKVC